MRDILFRGKRKSDGKWIYGMFVAENYDADFPCIIPEYDTVDHESADWHVGLQTVGQYTGLVDKNGRKIFEGDILRIKTDCFSMKGVVEFNDGTLIVTDGDITECLWYKPSEMEVIGNIHDNPELMKEVDTNA